MKVKTKLHISYMLGVLGAANMVALNTMSLAQGIKFREYFVIISFFVFVIGTASFNYNLDKLKEKQDIDKKPRRIKEQQ